MHTSPGPLRCSLRWRDGAMERCGCCGWLLDDDTMTQKPQKPQKLHTSRVLVTVKPCLHSVPNTVGQLFRCFGQGRRPSVSVSARPQTARSLAAAPSMERSIFALCPSGAHVILILSYIHPSFVGRRSSTTNQAKPGTRQGRRNCESRGKAKGG